MKWVRRLVGLLILAVIVAGGYLAFRPQPLAVDLAEVIRGDLEVSVEEDGKTKIREKYVVATPVGGRLERIKLREGDAVLGNQTVLASIRPSAPDLLDARSMAEIQARVLAARASVERAKTRSDQAKIELDHAEQELRRSSTLIESRAISQSEFDKTQADFRTRSQIFRSAEFDKEIAIFELKLNQAALVHVMPDVSNEELNADRRDNFDIQSPIDGLVLRVLQESSTIVSSGTPIVEIGDLRDLEVVVDVLSTDAVKIKTGTRVYLEHWGGDRFLMGTVRFVEPSAFEKISALGVEEQRVNVIVDFEEDGAAAGLGDGYRVEARMVVELQEDVIKVPTSALFRDGNDWAVFIQDDGVAARTIVKIGARNGAYAQVIDGLDEGQRVVMHPSDTLVDGSLIVER